MDKAKLLRPVVALVVALAVLFSAVAYVGIYAHTTNSNLNSLERTLHQHSPCVLHQPSCHGTINGIIDTMTPPELRDLGHRLSPYIHR